MRLGFLIVKVAFTISCFFSIGPYTFVNLNISLQVVRFFLAEIVFDYFHRHVCLVHSSYVYFRDFVNTVTLLLRVIDFFQYFILVHDRTLADLLVEVKPLKACFCFEHSVVAMLVTPVIERCLFKTPQYTTVVAIIRNRVHFYWQESY